MRKLQRLAACLTLTAVTLLSACTPHAPALQTGTPSAPAQAAGPANIPVQAVSPRTLEGKVVGVADGDTLTVLDSGNRQTRVRLQGIDAPESAQAFGQVSKRNLSDLAFGRQVVVEYGKTDRYGRTLGKVLVAGRDVNLEQVRAGLAWHYKYYREEQSPDDRRLYAAEEEAARSARRGLWVDPHPVPPWDFRRGKRERAEDEGRAEDDARKPAPASAAGRTGEGRTAAASEPEGETVYVTRTGSKYHRSGCQYLRRSRIPVSLKEAKQSYEPCSVCRPPR